MQNHLPNDIAPTKRGEEQLISLQDEAIDPDIKLLVKIIFNGTDSSSTSKRDDKQLIGLQDKSFDLDIKGLIKIIKNGTEESSKREVAAPKIQAGLWAGVFWFAFLSDVIAAAACS